MNTILLKETITGSQNNNKLSAVMLGTLNTDTGECSASFYLSEVQNPSKVALMVDVKITMWCPGLIKPQLGAQNLSDIINQSNYTRILTYKFVTGEELIFTSQVDLQTNTAVTIASGGYPSFLDKLVVANKLLLMVEPATMNMFNSVDNSGVTYQGRIKFSCGGIIFPIDITSVYTFKGNRLANSQKVIFENGTAGYDLDNNLINEYVKINIIPDTKPFI